MPKRYSVDCITSIRWRVHEQNLLIHFVLIRLLRTTITVTVGLSRCFQCRDSRSSFVVSKPGGNSLCSSKKPSPERSTRRVSIKPPHVHECRRLIDCEISLSCQRFRCPGLERFFLLSPSHPWEHLDTVTVVVPPNARRLLQLRVTGCQKRFGGRARAVCAQCLNKYGFRARDTFTDVPRGASSNREKIRLHQRFRKERCDVRTIPS